MATLNPFFQQRVERLLNVQSTTHLRLRRVDSAVKPRKKIPLTIKVLIAPVSLDIPIVTPLVMEETLP